MTHHHLSVHDIAVIKCHPQRLQYMNLCGVIILKGEILLHFFVFFRLFICVHVGHPDLSQTVTPFGDPLQIGSIGHVCNLNILYHHQNISDVWGTQFIKRTFTVFIHCNCAQQKV